MVYLGIFFRKYIIVIVIFHKNDGIIDTTVIKIIQELLNLRNEVSDAKHPMEIFDLLLASLKCYTVSLRSMYFFAIQGFGNPPHSLNVCLRNDLGKKVLELMLGFDL